MSPSVIVRSFSRRLASAALLALAAPTLAEDPCPSVAGAQPLGGGSAGAFGVPQLVPAGEPLVGLPFSLRVSDALPGSFGTLFVSDQSTPLPLPGFGAVFHPLNVLLAIDVALDANGESGPLLAQSPLNVGFCGKSLVLQAAFFDPAAQGQIAFSDAWLLDLGGKDLSGPPPGSPVPEQPQLDPFAELTNLSSLPLSGTALGATSVEIEGPTGLQILDVSNDAFAGTVYLAPNQTNHLFLTAVSDLGARSTAVSAAIQQDEQAPFVFLDFPPEGAVLSTPTVDVAGRVGDVLAGFQGLRVTINGVNAAVDPGIGTNGSFFLADVPLNPDGSTTLLAVATDVLGNSSADSVQVQQQTPSGPQFLGLQGNGQTAPAGQLLPQAIGVTVVEADGSTPIAGKTVTFEVVKSDGTLASTPGGDPTRMLQVKTDAFGVARAHWTLGSDAGCGNNRVRATSVDIAGSLTFCASGAAGAPLQTAVTMGSGQRGEVGTLLPMPLTAWVSDGGNPVPNALLEFTVVEGGGLVNGQTQVTIQTDSTGHGGVDFELGLVPGVQIVEAGFPGQASTRAQFRLTGIERDETQPTRFDGVVYDNSWQPLGGVECRLELAGFSLSTTTDAQGTFAFEDTLTSGPAHLYVEGSTAATVGGLPIEGAVYPKLAFLVNLVPNAQNRLPVPIALPPLRDENARTYSTSEDTLLTMAGMEGLELRIAAGSMSIDGAPAPDGTVVSINQVHFDEIPMPLPDGAAAPFAWTMQPGGASFDPPVEIRMPNLSGLAPGSVMYFLSFDHALEEFVIVGAGEVDEEGASMRSLPGSGISIAGWSGFCPPYPCNYTGRGEVLTGEGNGVSNDGPTPGGTPGPSCNSSDGFLSSMGKMIGAIDSGNTCQTALDGSIDGLTRYKDCVGGAANCAATAAQKAQSLPGTSTAIASGPPGVSKFLKWAAKDAVGSYFGGDTDTEVEVVLGQVTEILVVEQLPCVIWTGDVTVTYDRPPLGLPELGGVYADGLEQFDLKKEGLGYVEFTSVGPTSASGQFTVFDLDQRPSVSVQIGFNNAELDSVGYFNMFPIPVTDGQLVRPVMTVVGQGYQEQIAGEPFMEPMCDDLLDWGEIEYEIEPQIPAEIELFVSQKVLVDAMAPIAAQVTGRTADGTEYDATSAQQGTWYTSSNADILTVDSAGNLTPQSNGNAVLTASNSGTTATCVISVLLDEELTTVEGFVRFEGGAPAPDVRVEVSGLGQFDFTDAQGFFSIPDVPASGDGVLLVAELELGGTIYSTNKPVAPLVPDGITDAGILILNPAVFWLPSADGSWSDPSNWSTNSVPDADDAVYIDPAGGPFTITVSGGPHFAQSLSCAERLLVLGDLNVLENLNLDGELVLDGGDLSAASLQVGGQLELAGGTLRDARVVPSGLAPSASVTNDTNFVGVRLDMDLLVSAPDQSGINTLSLSGGCDLNANLTLTAGPSRNSELLLPGTQTLASSLGSGAVVLAKNNGLAGVSYLRSDPGGHLSLDSSLLVRGYGVLGRSDAALTLLGEIRADVSGERIDVLGASFTNAGTARATAQGTLNLAGPAWSSSGSIEGDGGVLVLGGTWTNTGTLQTQGGELVLGGDWAMQGLGSIATQDTALTLQGAYTLGPIQALSISGGSVAMTGQFDNTGTTLDLGAGDTSWSWGALTVSGGSVVGAAALSVVDAVTLDGVRLDADLLALPPNNGVRTITVLGDLDLNGTLTLQSKNFQDNTELLFPGVQTLRSSAGTGVVRMTQSGGGSADSLLRAAAGGSLTLDPGVTVAGNGILGRPDAGLHVLGTVEADNGSYALDVRGNPLSNAGNLRALSGGRLVIDGSAWSSSGSIEGLSANVELRGTWSNTGSITTDRGTLTLNGDWSLLGLGAISSTNSTLNLNGTYSLGELSTLGIASGTVNLLGTLDNSGGTLDLAPSGASWNLAGTVLGGTLSGGLLTVSAPSTFDGVRLDADVHVPPPSNGLKTITVLGGMDLNGTLTLESKNFQDNVELLLPGVQSLGSSQGTGLVALVQTGGGSADSFLRSDSGGSLTLESGLSLRGVGVVGRLDAGLNNLATIEAAAGPVLDVQGAPLSNAGTLRSLAGAHLVVNGPSWSSSGSLEASGGALTLLDAWSNAGSLVASAGATLTLSGDWSQLGLGAISLTDSTLNAQGAYTPAELASLSLSGGTVNLQGTLEGAGGTLDLAPSGASWNLTSGALIQGGTLLGGQLVAIGNCTLDGVRLDADLLVPPPNFGLRTVSVLQGLDLNGTITLQAEPAFEDSELLFPGVQTLSSSLGTGRVNLTANNGLSGETFVHSDAGGTLTIGSGVELHGRGIVGRSDASLLLHGRLLADQSGQTLDAHGLSVQASGELIAQSGAQLRANQAFSCAGHAQLAGGTLAAVGGIDLQGAGQLTGVGTLAGDVLNGGLVAPGASPGTLTITGAYTQTAAGTLAVEVAGPTPDAEHDVLAVQGAVALDGVLDLSLLPGYAPVLGEVYELMSFPAPATGGFGFELLPDPGPGLELASSLSANALRVEVVAGP